MSGQTKSPTYQQAARADERMEGHKDGETLFYRALPATTAGPKMD